MNSVAEFYLIVAAIVVILFSFMLLAFKAAWVLGATSKPNHRVYLCSGALVVCRRRASSIALGIEAISRFLSLLKVRFEPARHFFFKPKERFFEGSGYKSNVSTLLGEMVFDVFG